MESLRKECWGESSGWHAYQNYTKSFTEIIKLLKKIILCIFFSKSYSFLSLVHYKEVKLYFHNNT